MDHTLQKLRRMYRKTRRKPKGLKRLWAYLLNVPHIAVIVTAVVFVVVTIMWSLLWVFICKSSYFHRGILIIILFSKVELDLVQSAGKVSTEPILLGCSGLQMWSLSPSTVRQSPTSLCPWQPKYKLWYVISAVA